MKDTHTPVTSKKLIIILGGLIIILFVFRAGISIGYHQGSFSNNWDSNFAYSRGFGDPNSIFSPFMMRDGDDLNPHGTVGVIAAIRLPTILVKGTATAEQVVIISTSTTIRMFRSSASSTQLRAGDQVIVIGEPDNTGAIQASFIRIIPDLSNSTSTNNNSPGSMMRGSILDNINK